MTTKISADFPYESHYADVLGSKMHYIQQGQGDPILFLHGIPTSSYVWRNVIPHLATLGRCIAPDLIGFGKSDKPDIQYTLQDHIRYIEKFIEALNLKRITLVMHGFGSIIGFHYAMQHEKNCKGLVFYESYLREYGDDIPLAYQEQIITWQSEKYINEIIESATHFIDQALLQGTIRSLSPAEMAFYHIPFKQPGSGKPISQFIRNLNDQDYKKIIADYSKKLTQSSLPKLMLYSVPGFITTIETLMWAKDHLPNLEIVDMGEELHYMQESNPSLMGEAISIWLQGVEQNA